MKIPSEGKSHRRSASIHTTCECSDRYIALIIADSGISIHAVRERRRRASCAIRTQGEGFQSTPPVKAATEHCNYLQQTDDISIHAAREGGDRPLPLSLLFHTISIHAAREGGDAAPTRRQHQTVISIHAAREGGDQSKGGKRWCSSKFQSTPPVKAATESYNFWFKRITISIHAAREGGDG